MHGARARARGSRQAPKASDIHRPGAIAFERPTGKLPFEVPPSVAVWQAQPLAVLRLSELRLARGARRAAHALLRRCLSNNPKQRPTPDELLAAIPE